MITDTDLINQNGIKKDAPTEDVSSAVVSDNVAKAEDYKEWLEDAAEICGQTMKGDIDPVRKQAENLAPVADSLASQLGLENISGVSDLIDRVDEEDEEAEFTRMDEESRQFDFTAEDIGICPTNGSFSPALENAWINIERCKFNVERLEIHKKDAEDLILSIEQAGVIDYTTAIKLRDRVPGSMDKVNIKMFTKIPSTVGLKLAQEGSLAGKIILGGLILAGSIFLIYKILSWTIEGIKTIMRLIKIINERQKNWKRIRDKVGKETFDPETINLEKMAKDLFQDPTQGVIDKMKATGRQPLQLRDIKWLDTKDFNHLITPHLVKYLDTTTNSGLMLFNTNLRWLSEDVKSAIGYVHEILDGVNLLPGDELHAETMAECLDSRLAFIDQYIDKFSIPIAFSSPGKIDRVNALAEWLEEQIKPLTDYKLLSTPSFQLVDALAAIDFPEMNDEFANEITAIRDTLNVKAKKTVIEADTPAQADVRKEIIRDITLSFMALSNVVRSIYHFTVYVESLVAAEDKFINKIKKYTS